MTISLPENILAAIHETLGGEPTRVYPVGGGMINHAVQIEVSGERYFVKWKYDSPTEMFALEARGLEMLRGTSAFRIPEVIAYGEANGDLPGFLVLEWLPPEAQVNNKAYAENFGRALAALHQATGDAFGLYHDNYIGELPQRNTPSASWSAFYRDQRIAVQTEIARERGYLPAYRERLLNDLMERIESILGSAPNPPSLLHGDLWSGNMLVTAGHMPALVDPAVHYGDREVEIAYTNMFGGAPFYMDAYEEIYPLDTGYEYRRPLLTLSPLLVHLNHFGEQYGEYVDGICRHYLS
jgi:fructosamine-3-kinase